MSTKSTSPDPEKQLPATAEVQHGSEDDLDDLPRSLWGRSLAWSAKLERKIGIEAREMQRVPEDARPDHPSGIMFIWLTANCVLSTFGIGILGPALFFLGLGDSMLAIFFANAATCVLPAYMASFDPKLDLHQLKSARYSWGWHGAKIVVLLNCVACVGWSTISMIAGAQTLRSVVDETTAGVVIIAISTLALGMLGYKYVHIYEKWAWIPTVIMLFVVYGCAMKDLVNLMGTDQAEASNVLSNVLPYIGIIFGFAGMWVSRASDYNVYQPAETPTWKTFAWTYTGLNIPLALWTVAESDASLQFLRLFALICTM
ncbi:permease for cytosine/purines, uracil, thiamine, allantoin-domain-containing protein [Mycena vulgaris]|nr:permease for cytosine/purines, uracil, thiamine, allantoin-domain-containing protein [Mycena vulgaris]